MNKSKFKAEFTLKQHTPIIHFQSGQNGATLRATELKPKFDRFLLHNVEDIPFIKNANGHKSLDYKVTIAINGQGVKGTPNNFLYFANNSAQGDEFKYTIKSQSVIVTFFSYRTDLIESINRYFNDFLLITNFGSRSTKGYGSFGKSIENAETVLRKYYPIVFKITNVGDISKWEVKVDTIHKKLKSGINFIQYHKSLLFQYMCTQNIRWEKRNIKEKFSVLATGKPPIDCDTRGQYRYIRAMLGTAGINEYDRGNKTVTIDGGEIERFASPIIYKIIGNSIYLLGDKSYEKIMGKPFIFQYKQSSFTINTPSKSEFDLHKFLKFVEKNDNIISEVK
ncbi:MAG: hypothetical protein U9R27_06270 [Campylobacterota bacterium]|nr:hypothetical protein [Campylobacterota bacterium]